MFDATMVGRLAIVLLGLAPEVSPVPQGKKGKGQIMNLYRARPFVLDDGRAGLEMGLDGDAFLNVVFPPEGIPKLKLALEEIYRLSQRPQSDQKQH
ncbi:MAG: hypothetical protein FJX60_17735 [Alphaproteobacteria bacterium]|nr:hypothetical protein [Alphaproteobacteria bacterium]